MRSVNAPRVAHDATVELGEGRRVRAVNLSMGGIFVAADETLSPGEQVHLKVNLRDGAQPLDADAEVVWRADSGMALRFVGLDDVAKKRIQRLVHKREPTQFGKRDVRIHLPALPAPLRASARDLTERGVMIEAELPWLRLGSPVTTELSPERACDGRVQWIGLDVTRAGSARLRIFVDLTDEKAEGASLPPPAVFTADDALPIATAETRGKRSPWRWVWPSLALMGLVSTAALAGALVRTPPQPILLPTAPPEREAPVAHVPPRTAIPSETPEQAVTPTPATTTPPPAPAKPAHKAHAKKRAKSPAPRAG